MAMFLRSAIGEARYLIAIDMIETVLSIDQVVDDAGADEMYLGIINYKGKVIPVLDTRKVVTGKDSRFYLNSRVVVPIEQGLSSNAILIEKVIDLVKISEHEVARTKQMKAQIIILDQVPHHLMDLNRYRFYRELGAVHG